MCAYPNAAVIGAGSSGIAAAKALHERGVPFTVFEASDRVGGNWVSGNRNGKSAAYRQLHINTARERMEYSDFPMPKSYPTITPTPNIARLNGAEVEFVDGSRERVDVVVYCTGMIAVGRERADGGERARGAGYVPAIPARA